MDHENNHKYLPYWGSLEVQRLGFWALSTVAWAPFPAREPPPNKQTNKHKYPPYHQISLSNPQVTLFVYSLFPSTDALFFVGVTLASPRVGHTAN